MFDYFADNHDEQQIVSLKLPWVEVMEHYHNPIMATGLITTVFMMPKWRESNGATWEHQYAKDFGLSIAPIPEEWFEKK